MNKILIIDDNKINLLALKSIVNINFPNFNVITCSSGIEGLKIAKEINPKVILLDIVMPDMDGYEVCMKLKSDTILANIPVILITAYKTDVDSRIKGFNAGADAFLTKPIEPTELRAQLHSMIRIREMEEALKIRNARLEDLLITQTEKIWKKERKYQNLVETIEEGVINLDANENFNYANQAAAHIFGYTVEELLSKNLKDVIAPEMINKVYQESKNRQLGVSSKYELIIIRKNGVKRIIKVTVTPKLNKENKFIGSSGIFFDITQQVNSVNELKNQYELTKLVSEISSIDQMCEAILNYLLSHRDIDAGGIYIVDEESKSLILKKSAGLNNEFIQNATYFDANSPQAKMVNKGKPIFKPYNKLIDNYKEGVRIKTGLKAIGIIPLLHKNKVIAAINLASYSYEEFSEHTIKILRYIPAQFGSAFARTIAENKLKQSEEKFRSFVENTNIAVYETNVEGDIIYANQASLKLGEFDTEEELYKKGAVAIYKNPNDRQRFIAEIKKHGKVVNFETQLITSKNKTISTIINATLLGDNLIGMIIDITERKKTEQELRKFKTISDTANYGTCIFDSKGKLLYVNNCFAEMHNYTADEIVGQNLTILHNEEQIPSLLESQNSLHREGYFTNIEVWHARKDATVFPTLMNAMTIFDEEKNEKYFSATAIDISDIIDYEKKLKYALQKSEEADSLKSSFLATMSHELRTPLTAIIGFSEIIDKEMPIDEIITLNQMINSSGIHLSKIIDDIFQLSLLESGELKVTQSDIQLIDLASKIKLSLDIESKNFDNKEIFMEFIPDKSNEELSINIDGEKLYHIVMNILNNAFKFSKDVINIKYGYKVIVKENQKHIQFFVQDMGIGIDQKYFNYIFEKFRQVEESHTRKYEGAGIGLTISKKLTDLLGGTISIKSELGKGSTFFVDIPIKISKKLFVSEESTITEDKINTLKGKTILIVEDEESNFALIEMVLKKFEAKTLWAKNGKEALDFIVYNQNIDLVIMDIRMPELDGYETSTKIRVINKNLPIIAYTAYALYGDEEKSLNAGCDDYLKKPAKASDLIKMIKKHIQKK